MPQHFWSQSEIEKVVVLRYDGMGWLDIAKQLTSENLKGFEVSAEAFLDLDEINRQRKRSARLDNLFLSMRTTLDQYGHAEIVSDEELRKAIVLPARLDHIASTDRYKEYYELYETERKKAFAERARDIGDGG